VKNISELPTEIEEGSHMT